MAASILVVSAVLVSSILTGRFALVSQPISVSRNRVSVSFRPADPRRNEGYVSNSIATVLRFTRALTTQRAITTDPKSEIQDRKSPYVFGPMRPPFPWLYNRR
jgi:hypothetical protein